MGAIQQLLSSYSIGDPILSLNPDIFLIPSSIDESVTVDATTLVDWVDTSGNGLDGTISGSVRLNLDGADRQVEFNGGYIDFPSSALLDKDVGTAGDSFTIIYREGSVSPTNGTIYSKAVATAANREYQQYYNTVNAVSHNLAGREEAAYVNETIPSGTNRLFVTVITADRVSSWCDGTLYVDNVLINGAEAPSAQTLNLGSRTDGGFLVNSGATMDMFAIIPSAITTGQRTAIGTEWQVN